MSIHPLDLLIFVLYLLAMLAVGVYFMRKNRSDEDYYVGGRNMGAGHIGLSVVATDVGGGFSIGLGGLGFAMGIAGSWMLFTGLIGAWLSATLLIPRIYPMASQYRFLTFPQSLAHRYNLKVALVAGIISLIGYLGFTSSQILAGAKLASATFPEVDLKSMVLIMGVIAVVYTVIGGIKAVIYTDTVQWIILMAGLIGIGIPLGYQAVGGWAGITQQLPDDFLSLSNITWVQFFNWFITIVPIWFVGMTLYQRIYACRDERSARKAWYIAGLFEWPLMAFMGVLLGLFARVAWQQGMFAEVGYGAEVMMDEELGFPLLIRHVLPVGLMGLMMSAYFSAIMSTADSCLMAASGNLITDVLGFFGFGKLEGPRKMRVTQLLTLAIGVLAILLATFMQDVLELMLYSYAFMVSGLLVPVIAMLVLKKPSPRAALFSMVIGGSTTLALIVSGWENALGLDANVFGIGAAAITFILIQTMQRT